MATALTTSWQTVATGSSSFTYGGNTYYITVYLQAYYEPYSATQAKIHLRELLSTSNSAGWSGTNKHYRVRFYPYENPPEDSGYNQDSTQWYAPGSSYYLPDSSGTVTHIINYGASIDIVAYYLVDVAPSSEIDLWTQVYAPSPAVAPATPTISSRTIASNSVAITYGTTSFGTPSTGTVTLYGGTTANPTTVLDTYNATGNHTFTHTGLTPGTTYYYRARANNGQLDSNYSTEISVTTYPPYGFYGSVNGQTKRVTKMYGPVDVTTTTVTGVIRAGGVGNIASFDGNTFWSYASPSLNYTDVKTIGVTNQTFSWRIFVQYVDANHGSQVLDSSISTSNLQNYGITPISGSTTAGTDYIDVTITTTTNSVSKEIIKMYGPVQVAEQYSITPDGLVVTAIDGELLCATAKGQYPSTYMNAVTFEFGLDSLYYARGLDSNNNQVFYRSGSASALASAGVTFSPSVTSGVSTTLPTTYVPAASVAKRIF